MIKSVLLAILLGNFVYIPAFAVDSAACIRILERANPGQTEFKFESEEEAIARAEAEEERLFTLANYNDDLDLGGVAIHSFNPEWNITRERSNELHGEKVSAEVIARDGSNVYIRGEVTGSRDWKTSFILTEESSGKEFEISYDVPSSTGKRMRFIELQPAEDFHFDQKWLAYRLDIALAQNKDNEIATELQRVDWGLGFYRRLNSKNKNLATRQVERFLGRLNRLFIRGDVNGVIDQLTPIFKKVEVSVVQIRIALQDIENAKKLLKTELSPEDRLKTEGLIVIKKRALNEARRNLGYRDFFAKYRVATYFLEKVIGSDPNVGPYPREYIKNADLAYRRIKLNWRDRYTIPTTLNQQEAVSRYEAESMFHHPVSLLRALKWELLRERVEAAKNLFNLRNIRGRVNRALQYLPLWARAPLTRLSQGLRVSRLIRKYYDDIESLKLSDVSIEIKIETLRELTSSDDENEMLELFARLPEEKFWNQIYQKAKDMVTNDPEVRDNPLLRHKVETLVKRMEAVVQKIKDKNLTEISVDHPRAPIDAIADALHLIVTGGGIAYYQAAPFGQDDHLWRFLDVIATLLTTTGEMTSNGVGDLINSVFGG